MHRYLVKMQEKTEKATETEASNKPATLVSVCIQVLKDLQHKSIALICDASPKAKHDEPRLQIGVGLHWDYILWVTGRLRCGFQCSGFRIACVWELCSDCRRCCPVLLRHRRSWE